MRIGKVLPGGSIRFDSWGNLSSGLSWDLSRFGGGSTGGTRRILLEIERWVNGRWLAEYSDATEVYYYIRSVRYGSNCSGSVGAPSISGTVIPTIGQTATFRVTRAQGFALWALGASRTNWNGIPLPMAIPTSPACFLNTSLDVVWPPQSALTEFRLPLPADPGLVGLTLYTQALLLSSLTNTDFVTSEGMTIPINGL